MATKERYTAEQIISALEDGKGYVGKTASILQCDPDTVYEYSKKYVSVARAWRGIRENRHDFVESKLAGRIDDGDTTAIIFYLKTQCKSRGYVERQEVTGAEGGPLVVRTINWHDENVD